MKSAATAAANDLTAEHFVPVLVFCENRWENGNGVYGKDILYVKGNPEKIISLCSGISDEEKEKT